MNIEPRPWGEHPRMCAQCYSCVKWANGCAEGRKPIPTRRCLGYEPMDEPKVQEAKTQDLFGEAMEP